MGEEAFTSVNNYFDDSQDGFHLHSEEIGVDWTTNNITLCPSGCQFRVDRCRKNVKLDIMIIVNTYLCMQKCTTDIYWAQTSALFAIPYTVS